MAVVAGAAVVCVVILGVFVTLTETATIASVFGICFISIPLSRRGGVVEIL